MSPIASQRFLGWLFTIMFALPLGVSGLAYLLGLPLVSEAIARLGYPEYVLKILGAFKVLGVSAILFSPSRVLKEWAYAGFAFNLIGALASHYFAGDPSYKLALPLVLLMLGAASYVLWKQSERPERQGA